MENEKKNGIVARTVNDTNDATKLIVNTYCTKRPEQKDLLELAQEVQQAHKDVRCVASGKLQIIAEQIKFLQEQAKRVLEEAKESSMLHNAHCNFVKKPGNIYYLYERESGLTYFSMVSPTEWTNCPHKFQGAYRLENDKSWTKEKNIVQRDKDHTVVESFLNHGSLPALEYGL